MEMDLVQLKRKGMDLCIAVVGEDVNTGLRIKVVSGGCSGFKYQLTFSKPDEKDSVFEEQGVRIIVDPESLALIDGATLDYSSSLQLGGLILQNPKASRTCGCGESFSA